MNYRTALLQAYAICLVSFARCFMEDMEDDRCLDLHPATVYVAEGELVRLNCSVTSSAAATECPLSPGNLSDVTVRRFPKGTVMMTAGRRVQVQLLEDDTAQLSFDARFSDEGNVFCSLHNVTGYSTMASHPTYIYVLRPPVKPRVDRCVVDNWQRLTCWWKPSTEQQTLHMLHYSNVSNEITWTTAGANWTSWQTCTPTTTQADNSSTCTLTHNVDMTDTYCVRVNVKSGFLNIFVLSDVVCSPLTSIVRPAAPTSVSDKSLNSSHVELRWTRRYSQYAHYLNVSLIYRLNVTSQWLNKTSVYEAQSETVVVGVVPYTQYKVTITEKPILEGYWSQPSATYEFITPPTVPCRQATLAPDIYYRKPDIVRLYWKALSERDHCGPDLRYSVVVHVDPTQNSTPTAAPSDSPLLQQWTHTGVTVDASRTSADVRVSRLSRSTDGNSRRLSVLAVNRQGLAADPLLQSVTVTTSDPVGSVGAEGDDNNTVRMRWTRPSDVRASDVTSVTFYWCLSMSTERGACANEVNWLEVSDDKLVATPVELEVQLNERFNRYQVGVAVNVIDHTSTVVVGRRRPIKWADCIHQRNAQLRAPSRVNATAKLTGELGQVLVTWTTPDCFLTSGLVDTFTVEYCIVDSRGNCTGNTNRTTVPAIDAAGARQYCEIAGLKDDTRYGFRVYSSAGARRSPPSAFVVTRTASAGPPITVITGVIIAAVILLLLLLVAASVFRRNLRKCRILVIVPEPVEPIAPEINERNEEYQYLKPYDSLTCSLLKRPDSRSRSDDSGIGVEDQQLTPSPSVSTTINNEIFQPFASSTPYDVEHGAAAMVAAAGNDVDVALDNVMTTTTRTSLTTPIMSPNGYVIAWKDDDNQSVIIHSHGTFQDAAEHLVSPGDRSTCHCDAAASAATWERVTANGALRVSDSVDEVQSPLDVTGVALMSTCPHDVTQTLNSDHQQSKGVPYITLEQLERWPSSGFLDNRLHSNESPL